MSEQTEHPPSSPTLEERAQRIIDTVETVAMFLPVVGGRQTDMMTDTAALLRDFLAARRQVEAQHQEDFAIEREDATQWRIACGKADAELATLRDQLTEREQETCLWREVGYRYEASCGYSFAVHPLDGKCVACGKTLEFTCLTGATS